MLTDSWETCVEEARGDCGARLTPLIPEAMCRSHSGLHSRQGKAEWLVDEGEHPSRMPWDATPGNAAVCLGSAPRLVTQTSGYVGLGKSSSF